MNQRIIYQTDDGGVAVIIPAPEAVSMYGIEAIAQKDVPAGATFQILDAEALPDRTFRAAWKMTGNKVATDLPKAREIAHERRRAKREAEFAPHDAAIAKQLPGNDKAETERVKIRAKYDAMQAAIDAAKTPEELKAVLD